jgi:hypothetical protein
MTTTTTATELRRCKGSARFGIEPHEAPINDFPVQPSQKDGLGRMCKPHWRQYTNALRKAAVERKAAEADVAPEAEPAPKPVDGPHAALEPAPEATIAPDPPRPVRTRRVTIPTEPEPAAA